MKPLLFPTLFLLTPLLAAPQTEASEAGKCNPIGIAADANPRFQAASKMDEAEARLAKKKKASH